jgi:hypothetical protein
VQTAGYQAAFQLSAPQDPSRPLLTIRRALAVSTLTGGRLVRLLNDAF